MRFTPAAVRAATVNDLPLIPTMKLNGLPTAAHTARTESKSGRPGAISASAPAASYAFSRLIVSSRSSRPRKKFSVRPVSVNGNGSARAAAAAAAMRSVAWPSSKIGAPGLPLASSIEQPTSPDSAASLIVSATISGASPKPFSRSAETGRSVASQITRDWANASSRVTRPSRRPSNDVRPSLLRYGDIIELELVVPGPSRVISSDTAAYVRTVGRQSAAGEPLPQTLRWILVDPSAPGSKEEVKAG